VAEEVQEERFAVVHSCHQLSDPTITLELHHSSYRGNDTIMHREITLDDFYISQVQ
jgi:hypothetical protein